MVEEMTDSQEDTFMRTFLIKVFLPIILVGVVTSFYLYAMSFVNHHNESVVYIIVAFALLKTLIFAHTTIKQLAKLIKKCYSFNQLLLIFGSLIGLSVFSFATDYSCLFMFNNQAFGGAIAGEDSLLNLFHFFYFSLTTFSTIGYGDISPASDSAKLIVMFEIFLSFLIIVFALSNISKMHISENNEPVNLNK